jgi:hypothetical protein
LHGWLCYFSVVMEVEYDVEMFVGAEVFV